MESFLQDPINIEENRRPGFYATYQIPLQYVLNALLKLFIAAILMWLAYILLQNLFYDFAKYMENAAVTVKNETLIMGKQLLDYSGFGGITRGINVNLTVSPVENVN